ncbi:hypothetical protein BBB39_16205 [Bordetella trematum]|uniref:Lipoprotein n=1 Tax=Bordetella trematum TaxID=123899 RepID=A0A157KWB8_9BORD|nr:hypothetical protein [Bordetella trematum]AZR95125.1 hypothetical protein BBB39_16205 [Bordetella trematum]NNH18674.1 hypothetical protein [Bordetella trematum]SAH88903.1 Uncharacterised protein [Bordetella trematum]SAI66565.1 Uncharacterised protein [Bordetella trematum]SUV96546.1 Uncharacterised protein [Bordetella trematum]
MKKLLIALPLTVAIAGCSTDADVAQRNLSKAADQFEINRRIVFYNGITDRYMLSIEGLCSVETSSSGHVLHVICKTGPSEFKKHMLGLSDNVTFFVEQLHPAKASVYHYRVVFKPQAIIPDIEFAGSTDALKVLAK